MTPDRPVIGILLMLGFCVLAPLGDSIAKYIGDSVGLGFLVAVRFVVQAAILVPLAIGLGLSLRLPRRAFLLTGIRTLLHIAGIATMFLALRFLPLAEAVAIAFVMPFIMLVLGKTVLGEEVGARRILACLVGFAGTLMVIQPTFANVGAPALLPLGVAVIFALFMLVTRQVAKEADPLVLQAVSGAMASVLLLPMVALSLPGFVFATGGNGGMWLLAGLGVLGTAAHLMMTWSLRFAPSATLAPMQYLEIPVAAVVGWLVFDDFPNGLALFGIGVTIASGLYILARERSVSRSGPLSKPQPAPPSV